MKNLEKLWGYLDQKSGNFAIDAAVIFGNVNRRYFSGFNSSAGAILVTREKAYLLVDFRYFEAAKAEVSGCEIVLFKRLEEKLVELLKLHGAKCVAFESADLSIKKANQFKSSLEKENIAGLFDGTLDHAIKKIRMIKSADEIDKIKKAQKLSEAALRNSLGLIRNGTTERDLALEIEFFMRKNGAEAVSFDLIVVSGKNTSLPHGVPTNKKISRGDFVTIDIGAVVDGYHSDMTRTVALGSVSDEQRHIYEIVLQAQKIGIDAIKPGVKCSDVDKSVRDFIYDAGYAGCFDHATGHGVGMNVHEAPVISALDDTELKPNMVITVEPGIYLPGRFGARIEDLILVTQDGYENLTDFSKELMIV